MVEENIKNFTVLKIQKEDILVIKVSSLNVEASAIFNMGNTSSAQASASSGTGSANSADGFLVDQNGEIQLPIVGSIPVAGLTTAQARDLVHIKLMSFLKEPVVSVRIANLKVSVLGDVGKPGVYPFQNERMSVTEALGMAGDLNITALRNNVLLVREVQGKRQYIRLDLQKKELFNQPYFYLQNNDVLYVQPSNAKYASVDSTYRNVGVVLSIVSLLALLIIQL
jgi:polysaccharide export outer membrane protein